ncbi:pilus assembly protein PilP [Nitrogeniibacter aestuarii]|uniref:pilus assembly protein PilP n=1 Tax=Nitrogeniibacter aestuarii TaxID=2815343 RepID=UPI001D0F5661|nr:pilus assembly protein PilP [Nitrogeniibacter aestuarii]
MKKILFLVPFLLLGCSGEQEDLKAWMEKETAGMRGQVKPLPEMEPFPSVDYEGFALSSPFDPSKFVAAAIPIASSGVRPDVNRQREPLEAFPLESLKMVGSMTKNGVGHALIDADGSVYQIKTGNYMGQNFGVVTKISETEVTLKELVEDLNGDWVERTTPLYLQGPQETTQ